MLAAPETPIQEPAVARALWAAWGLSALLLAAVWIAQLVFELLPCQICLWQRIPHYAVMVIVPLASVAVALGALPARGLIVVAALVAAVLASGALLAGWHAGIEYGWWQGLDSCGGAGVALTLSAIAQDMQGGGAPPSCSEAAWTLLGISLAGYNAILSGTMACIVAVVLRKYP